MSDLPRDPIDRDAILERVRLLWWKRPELALEHLARLLAKEPGFAQGHADAAKLLATLGRTDRALESARRAIELAPDDAWCHSAHAYVQKAYGAYDAALRSARQAIALDPEELVHRLLECEALLESERFGEGLAAAERALALAPGNVDALNLRACALVHLGRPEEAVCDLDMALASDPENSWAHELRGEAVLRTGEDAGAVEHFAQALRLVPDRESARAGLVEALRRRHRVYRYALRLRGSFRYVWVLLLVGVLLIGLGLVRVAGFLFLSFAAAVVLVVVVRYAFDLLLLFHRAGRHALPAANRHGLIFGGALVVMIGGFVSLRHEWDVAGGAAIALLLFPLLIYVLRRAPTAGVRLALSVPAALLVVGFGAWAASLVHLEQLAAAGQPADPKALSRHRMGYGGWLLILGFFGWGLALRRAPLG